ncbi:porin [Aquabacterium sp.]|uniref:porin n=1 Tax=Aquabacterium sp. TaxID=1872578 RepID=UPI003B696127
MKKTLLALAAIAASSAAFAQSSVTLYGVVDASVESVKGAHTLTRVTSDNLSTSRIGFKGTEDIGGGLKANFALESALKVDTGAQGNTARFFDRQAWVGLTGGFGEVRLGRQDSPIGDIARNVLVAQTYDDLKAVSTRAGVAYTRADNAITYILPTVVPGLTASLQYSTAVGSSATGGAAGAENIGDAAYGANSKAYGLGVKYVAGPVFAGVGYQYNTDELVTAGKQKSNATLGYAGYDFGVAKVTAYFDGETSASHLTGLVAGARRMQVYGAKVAVPVAPQFTVIASGSVARNVATSGNSASDVQFLTVRALYDLSKRTTVYAMFTNVNNDTASTLTFGDAVAAGKTSRGLAAGIKHTF